MKLGDKWRIPTVDEWSELRRNCTWTWKSNYNGTGKDGYLVTSKKNGNSIFLPAAGYRDGGYLYDAGFYGYYWSSSLDTDNPIGAYFVSFYSGGVDRNNGYGRRYGRSVRSVSE